MVGKNVRDQIETAAARPPADGPLHDLLGSS
jgi:hypothetical protein